MAGQYLYGDRWWHLLDACHAGGADMSAGERGLCDIDVAGGGREGPRLDDNQLV